MTTRSKKIAHFISSLGSGGAEAILNSILTNTSHIHKHKVICIVKRGKYVKILEEKGIEVYGFLEFLIQHNKSFDIYQGHMYHGDLIALVFQKIFGGKESCCFWAVHNTSLSLFRSSWHSIFISKLNRFLSYTSSLNSIIYCSESSKIFHEKRGYAKKGVLIFNGYDEKKFKIIKSDLRKDYMIALDTKIIISVGRYSKQKNHNFLFKCLKNFNKSFKLLLIGDGCDKNNLQLMEQLKKYSIINDTFLIGLSDNLNYFYSGADICVLVSSYGEAFPNVLNESLLCGTHCISSNIGDARKILQDENYLFNINNEDEFLERLNKVSEINVSDEYKNQLRESVVTRFPMRLMIKKYIEVWDV